MKRIFEQGEFNRYSQVRLDEAKAPILSYVLHFGKRKATVFISHKHDDLVDLKGIIGFLEKEFGIIAYIDSLDTNMPRITSAETAKRIKDRINQCDKFILLATNGAVESIWCNWELGYGDAKKYDKDIALFPMKPYGTSDDSYKGSEYLSIYPIIVYLNGNDKDDNENRIEKGYYVLKNTDEGEVVTPLAEWFN